jgi:hypothetical protein
MAEKILCVFLPSPNTGNMEMMKLGRKKQVKQRTVGQEAKMIHS